MEFAVVSDWRKHPCEEAQLEEIYAKELGRRGHRMHWAAFIPGLAAPLERTTWHGHPLTLFRRGAGNLPNLRRWLSALLAERPLDFVQVRNDPAFALLAGSLARRAGRPFVYHLSVLNGPGLVEESREESGPRRWATLAKGLVGGALVDRVALSCDLLLPISEEMAGHYRQLGRRGASFALPMGCVAPRAAPPRAPDGRVEVLYIGAMDVLRRLEFLLEALVLARREEPSLRLTFLGASRRAGDVERLKARAAALGLGEAVRFEAPVPRPRVAARIEACDIGVSPVPPTSYHRLSSPTKLMECLGLGRPAVANDIPEQRRVLEESGGGLAVPYDAAAFGAALAALARDPARRAEMGRRGAAYMARERDYAVLAARVEDAYRRLLGAA